MTAGHLFVRGKKMNKKQLVCLWIGIIVIVLMGLFPPTKYDSAPWGRSRISWWEGFSDTVERTHNFLFDIRHQHQILLGQLCIRWVIVAAITGGLICTFKDKEKEGTEE